MFEKLLVTAGLKAPNTGYIWSLEGDHYLAFLKNEQGEVIKQGDHTFRSLFEAKEWLNDLGAHEIVMEQSTAYFEMVGLDDTKDELRGRSELRM